jgi:hypothetical protein
MKPTGIHYPKFTKPLRTNAQMRADLAKQLAEALKRWDAWRLQNV